jgi:hypothetical protein
LIFTIFCSKKLDYYRELYTKMKHSHVAGYTTGSSQEQRRKFFLVLGCQDIPVFLFS